MNSCPCRRASSIKGAREVVRPEGMDGVSVAITCSICMIRQKSTHWIVVLRHFCKKHRVNGLYAFVRGPVTIRCEVLYGPPHAFSVLPGVPVRDRRCLRAVFGGARRCRRRRFRGWSCWEEGRRRSQQDLRQGGHADQSRCGKGRHQQEQQDRGGHYAAASGRAWSADG